MHAELHQHLDEIASRALLPERAVDAELAEADAQALGGCSLCARALVNARDAGVDLAIGDAALPAARPSDALKQRLFEGRSKAPSAAPAEPPARPRPQPDPSAAVAAHHLGAPGDAERIAEIDVLGALTPVPDENTPRLLAQIERLLRFPLLFVSVVRGERVGYRAERGLEATRFNFRDLRREATYCTHTLSSDGPFIVRNAPAEAFFRGSRMSHRYGVHAYVGVPLRTSRGIVIGNLCALDFRPRAIGAEEIRALELFTRPVLAEIERPRYASARAEIYERTPLKMGPQAAPNPGALRASSGASFYRQGWFRDLLEVQLALLRRSGPGVRTAALVCARGALSTALPSLGRDDEPAGRIHDDAVALLLPGSDLRGAENRLAELREGLRAAAGPGHAAEPELVALVADASCPSVEAWCAGSYASRA
jgi:GAF domain-containing protein